jgi:hypothetical protein
MAPKHTKRPQAETLPVTPTFEQRSEVAKNPGSSVPRVNLLGIREDATAARADTTRTIAELETWRDEIDAIIAFLRAQRK